MLKRVCHLAGEFVKHLKQQKASEKVSEVSKKVPEVSDSEKVPEVSEKVPEASEKVPEASKSVAEVLVSEKVPEASKTLISDEEELCIRLAGLCHDLGKLLLLINIILRDRLFH